MPYTRRELIRWMGVSAVAAALPISCSTRHDDATSAGEGFLTDAEKRALGRIADGILPPDDQPGGAALGAVEYTERLLTLFERGDAPQIFVGGPYSGRTPFADARGAPSSRFPVDDFVHFAGIDRVTERAWRLYLYGSDGVAGGGPNDTVSGKVVGLREQVRAALKRARAYAGGPIEDLDARGLVELLAILDADARDLFITLVSEAAFASPEYGGNPACAGWRMVQFEGDSQPLGYSLYDEIAKVYRERPESPMSTANRSDPEPMDAESRKFVQTIVGALGGKAFS